MRFGDQNFITNTEGGLERIYIPIPPANTTSSNPITESLRGLRLDTLESGAPACDRHPAINRGSAEHQLCAFLGA